MTGKPRSEALYLADIRDAIEKILSYTTKGRDAFFNGFDDAGCSSAQHRGDREAVRGIRPETRAAHTDVPRKDMAGMRTESSTTTSAWTSTSCGTS